MHAYRIRSSREIVFELVRGNIKLTIRSIDGAQSCSSVLLITRGWQDFG